MAEIELSTLGAVIKEAYEGESDTNAFTDAEKSKLNGIEAEATANASDADLRDRATHTGTQSAASIVDLPDLLAGKVDIVPGKVMSDANFTQAEKEKLAGLEDAHFKGVHVGLAGLEAAHPTGEAGDYAVVDDGVDLTWYQWDADNVEWTARVGESTEITPAQVKSYYESNPDTNAFTDDEKAALSAMTSAGRFTLRRRGTWNAATNTPALLDGAGTNGDFYVVTTAGTYNFGNGSYDFKLRDWVVFAGGVWQRLAINENVTSVNGKTGAVALTAADVGALPSGYTAPVTSVAGKTGAVTLASSDVGAKPSSYTPSWSEVTGKPAFDTLYAKKGRGGIIGPFQAAYLWRNAAIPIPTSTNTEFVPDSAVYDYFSMLSGGVITIPSWASKVRVTGQFTFETNPTGTRYVGVSLGSSVILSRRVHAISDATTALNFITPIWAASSGQVLSLNLFQNSGSTINLAASSWVNIELFEAN